MWTLDGNVCCIWAPPNRQIYWLIEFVITTYWIGEWHSLRFIKWKLAKEWVKSVLIKNGSKLQVIFIGFSKIIICILRTIFVKIGVFSSWSKKKLLKIFVPRIRKVVNTPLINYLSVCKCRLCLVRNTSGHWSHKYCFWSLKSGGISLWIFL